MKRLLNKVGPIIHKYFKLFSIKGIEIHVHWSALVILLILAIIGAVRDPSLFIVYTGLLLIIFVHEMGHAYVARWLGYSCYRVTINFIFGKCWAQPPETLYERALFAWGGVMFQCLLFLPAIVLIQFPLFNASRYSTALLATFSYLNGIWIAFNLAPTRRLDGGTAWKLVPILYEFKVKPYFNSKQRAKKKPKHLTLVSTDENEKKES